MAPAELSTLLRLVPLVTTSCSLWFSMDQHLFLSVFIEQENQALSEPLISPYFRTMFRRGAPRVAALLGATVLSTIANLRLSDASLLTERGSYNYYVAVGAFAVGHMLFVPWIKPSIDALHAGAKDRGLQTLGEWIHIHDYRTATADLAAWICCLLAVSKTLTP
ncbi:hypothetical protein SCUP515_02379 [Seiridium cupressi]